MLLLHTIIRGAEEEEAEDEGGQAAKQVNAGANWDVVYTKEVALAEVVGSTYTFALQNITWHKE